MLQGNHSKHENKKIEPNILKEIKLESIVKNSNNNNKSLLGTIGRRVAIIKSQYAALQKMNRELRCYAQNCSEHDSSDCYSPICAQRVRLRKELLLLLRKANSTRNNNNLVKKIEDSQKGLFYFLVKLLSMFSFYCYKNICYKAIKTGSVVS